MFYSHIPVLPSGAAEKIRELGKERKENQRGTTSSMQEACFLREQVAGVIGLHSLAYAETNSKVSKNIHRNMFKNVKLENKNENIAWKFEKELNPNTSHNLFLKPSSTSGSVFIRMF